MRILALLLCLAVPLQTLQAASPNFVDDAQDRYTRHAEQSRHDIAVFWLDKPMPRWSSPCKMTVKYNQNIVGGGAATTFSFHNGGVTGWRMSIEANNEAAVINDVIPHEVQHTVAASIAGRPLPRWLDEGIAQIFEPAEAQARNISIAKQKIRSPDSCLYRIDSMEYPDQSRGGDILAIYSTGYALVEYLLELKDHQVLWQFMLDTKPPSQKFQAYYGRSFNQIAQEFPVWLMRQDQNREFYVARWANASVAFQFAQTQKPTLLIFLGSNCLPCASFKYQYNTDAIFRAKLWEMFNLEFKDIENFPDLKTQYRIRGVPAFAVQGTSFVHHGYPGRVALVNSLTSFLIGLKQQQPQPSPTIPVQPPAVVIPTYPTQPVVIPTYPQQPVPVQPVPVQPVPAPLPSPLNSYVTWEQLQDTLGVYAKKNDVLIPGEPDLSPYATKEELKGFVTPTDVSAVTQKESESLFSKIGKTFLTKEEYQPPTEPKPFPWWMVAGLSGGISLLAGPAAGAVVGRMLRKRYISRAIGFVRGVKQEGGGTHETLRPPENPTNGTLALSDAEVSKLKQDVSQWEVRYESLTKQNKALESQIQDLNSRLAVTKNCSEVERLTIELEGAKQNLLGVRDDLETTSSLLSAAKQNNVRLVEELKSWQVKHEELRRSNDELNQRVNRLRVQISDLEIQPPADDQQISQLKEELRKTEAELRSAKDSLEIAQTSLADCRRVRDATRYVTVESERGLERMRKAMDKVVGMYPASKAFMQEAENHYKLIESGENHAY